MKLIQTDALCGSGPMNRKQHQNFDKDRPDTVTRCVKFCFGCRGFKIVGPFVVMIYKMIRTDLLRFFFIYLVFVIGFSQCEYSFSQRQLNDKGGMFLCGRPSVDVSYSTEQRKIPKTKLSTW